MSDRLQMQLMLDVATFCVFGTKKFPTRRQIVEQRAHFHFGSRRFAAVAYDVDLSAIDDDFSAGDRIRFARSEAETRNTGDARQRFAAKSQSLNSLQIG